MNKTLDLYNRLKQFPFGKTVFARGLTFRAPYFSTIHPKITDLREGFCSVEINDRRSIRNHFGTIHAGAMCTLSELAGGLAVEVSTPPNLRWIPKEMKVHYLKKAKGMLTATCSFDPQILTSGDIDIPLEIRDQSGDAVMATTIRFYISERKGK